LIVGRCPGHPEVYRLVFQGGDKKGDTQESIAASPNLMYRSGRTSALPYPVHE